jgi:hypothetical protein
MVVNLQTQQREVTRAEIIERVEALISDGQQLTEAAAAVWEQIEAAGEIEAVARLVGHRIIADIWRNWNISHRPAAVARTVTRPTAPRLVTASTGDILPPAPRPRVVDLTLVRETLDSKFTVDGKLWRLGDMTKDICMKVAEQYRNAAIADEHKSRHLRVIASKLEGDETVEQKLTEQEVMQLYRISVPAGNMLK